MSIYFPMNVLFTVVSASVTDESSMVEENLHTERRFRLVLRADDRTMIHLSSGESLSEIDVHFILSSDWKTPRDVDRELQPQDIGFLAHNKSQNDPPLVHGAAIWPSEFLPGTLLQSSVKGYVSLTLSSVPQVLDHEKPFIWSCGRLHSIRISHISVSAVRDVPHDES